MEKDNYIQADNWGTAISRKGEESTNERRSMGE